MPENNEPQYELDKDYAPLGIVDAADGSGTTWPEFVGQVNKMDNQVAALTENRDLRSQGTEDIPDLITAASGFTLDYCNAKRFGSIVYVDASVTSSAQVTAGQTYTVATVKEGMRPALANGFREGAVTTVGAVRYTDTRTWGAGTKLPLRFSYILE